MSESPPSDRDLTSPARLISDGAAPLEAKPEEQLANAAMALLGCRDAESVYDVVGTVMGLFAPGSIVIVNEADPDSDSFITRRVFGLDDSLLAKCADLVGFSIIGKSSVISPALRRKMLGGSLTRLDGGFPELAETEIPRSVAEIGARLCGIRDVYTIGIGAGDEAIGNIHILTRVPGVELPGHLIESFARHCCSTLAAIARSEELAASALRSRLLLESMSEGIAVHEIVLDSDGRPCDYRFLDVNPAFETMTGLKAADIIGHTVLEVLPATERSWIERYGRVALTGVPERFEDYAAQLGRHYQVVAYSPQPGQFASLISDITVRKLGERELRDSEQRYRQLTETLERRVDERTQELSRAVEDLTEANEAKRRFVRSMSHELRTPLNSVIGFSTMLADGVAGPVNEEQARQLAMVRNSGRHLLTLINEILDLSRIESGAVAVHLEPIDVAVLMDELVASVLPLARAKALDLSMELPSPVPALTADATLVRQILLNLLSNAIKFTDAGFVRLAVSKPSPQLVVFTVRDSGPGIALPERERIFGEFERGADHSPNVEGTGLGLAISRGLAGFLGGSVDLVAERGAGSVFTLTLPSAPEPAGV